MKIWMTILGIVSFPDQPLTHIRWSLPVSFGAALPMSAFFPEVFKTSISSILATLQEFSFFV